MRWLLLEVARRCSDHERRARDPWTPSDEGSWPPKSLPGGKSPNCRCCGRRVETFVASQFSAAEVDLNLLFGLDPNMEPAQVVAALGKMDQSRRW
jgi:hypothetical protein